MCLLAEEAKGLLEKWSASDNVKISPVPKHLALCSFLWVIYFAAIQSSSSKVLLILMQPEADLDKEFS